MKTYIFGQTLLNKPIIAHEWGEKNHPHLFVLGTVHGDEVEGTTAAWGLLQKLIEAPLNLNIRLTVVPILNADGCLAKTRQNSRGVDLNRNLPTKDWTQEFEKVRYYPGKTKNSEPENQALVKFIEDQKPQFIISLHSWKPMLNTNGDCSGVAEAIAEVCKYNIEPDIGYPTPGSLGAYAADDRQIPTITYEIERDMDQQAIIDLHVPALLAGIKAFDQRYNR